MKMITDMQTKIDEYVNLIDAINERVDDTAITTAILQEIRKDMRVEEMQRERYSSTGNLPATENQLAYLKKLGATIPEAGLTRQQASQMIDSLQAKKRLASVQQQPMRRP